MSFFDKINNYLIVNAIKEILKGRESRDPKESLPDSVSVGTFQKYKLMYRKDSRLGFGRQRSLEI